MPRYLVNAQIPKAMYNILLGTMIGIGMVELLNLSSEACPPSGSESETPLAGSESESETLPAGSESQPIQLFGSVHPPPNRSERKGSLKYSTI